MYPFDFNKDGQLDASERFIEYMTYRAVMQEDSLSAKTEEEIDEEKSRP